MTSFEIIGYCVILGIPLGLVLLSFIVALGKRPGLRRRRQEDYHGPERRCRHRENCINGKHGCKRPPAECPANSVQPELIIVQRVNNELE